MSEKDWWLLALVAGIAIYYEIFESASASGPGVNNSNLGGNNFGVTGGNTFDDSTTPQTPTSNAASYFGLTCASSWD
jgi:hypothetical protein